MDLNQRAKIIARFAAVGLFAVGAAAVSTATAVADPPAPVPAPPPPPPAGPPVPVVGAPLGSNGLAVLGQTGDAAPGPLGAPQVPGLDATTVLGQNALPSAPGAGPGTPPNLNIFNNSYGIAQNVEPAAPGQGQQFDVVPGQENADINRREWFGRYIDMYRAGMLEGGLLGQVPQEQLGEPLPGTAPPPGSNIPPGLVQFLPDPAALEGATPPAAPGVPPPLPTTG